MMNQAEHTVSSYDNELAQQERRVLEMAGLVEAQLAAAIEALMKRDVESAARIIAKDADVDEYDRKIETGALSILARRQPVAGDLRYVFGTIKMALHHVHYVLHQQISLHLHDGGWVGAYK